MSKNLTSSADRSFWSDTQKLKSKFGFDSQDGFIRYPNNEEDNPNKTWRDLAFDVKEILLNSANPAKSKAEIERRLNACKEFVIFNETGDLQEKNIFALRDLCFIHNALLHCDKNRSKEDNLIPEKLAKPLLELSKRVKLPPVMSYPLYILFNAKKVDTKGDEYEISDDAENSFTSNHNVEVLTKDTHANNKGHNDEANFVRIHLGIERESVNLFKNLFSILAISPEDIPNKEEQITENLKAATKSLKEMKGILNMMYFGTGKEVFSGDIRSFLKGTDGFKGGVFSVESKTRLGSYGGASGAQSPLFILIDRFLGVEEPPSVKDFRKGQLEFILPGAKSLINTIAQDSKAFQEHMDNSNNGDLKNSLIFFASELFAYRKSHMNMVSRYLNGQVGTGSSAPSVLVNLSEATQCLSNPEGRSSKY